jgi:AhpD family alkylhydroperoxidase
MRLKPIEKPAGLVPRIAYFMMRRRMGKVMTPVKVLTARMPGSFRLTSEISSFEMKKISLEPELHYLISVLVSRINGCGFCTDIGRAMAVTESLSLEKFDAVTEYRKNPLFTDRERAALAYAEEATRNKRVSNRTFEALRKQFSETQIAEITWVNAIENYYNLINIPLEIGSDGFCSIAERRAGKKSQAAA